MEPALSIRAMQPADADAVALLTAQLGYQRSPEDIRAWIEPTQRAESAADRQAAFVACLDNQVVGWIEVSIERRLQSAPFALIGGLVVGEHLRNRGIGLELCRHVEAWAWQRGLGKVRVTSRSTREAAHRFYLRQGYEAVKTSLVFEKIAPENQTGPGASSETGIKSQSPTAAESAEALPAFAPAPEQALPAPPESA